MNEEELKTILARKGYGIDSKPGYGIQPAFSKRGNPDTASEIRAWQTDTKDYGTGALKNLESTSGYESLLSERVEIGCTEIVVVRLRFYRRRLADYSRAISEKALVDGLAYAGLIRDDSENEIQIIDEGQVKVETNEEERTEITLEYPDVDLDNLWVKKTEHKQLGIKKK